MLVRLKPAPQTWVILATKRDGMIIIDTYTPLYKNSLCLSGIGIANVEVDRSFRNLIANFGDKPVDLAPKEVEIVEVQTKHELS